MLVTRVSPNQSNAAPLIGARAKNSQAASARHRSPGAARRRRQRNARSAFNVHKLADAKHARLKRPVLEDAPKPVAARQLLPRRGLLGDQVRVARERRYTPLRRRCSGAAQRRRTMPRRRRVRRFLRRRAPSRTPQRRRASRARGAVRQQIGHIWPLLLIKLAQRVAVGAQGVPAAAQEGN